MNYLSWCARRTKLSVFIKTFITLIITIVPIKGSGSKEPHQRAKTHTVLFYAVPKHAVQQHQHAQKKSQQNMIRNPPPPLLFPPVFPPPSEEIIFEVTVSLWSIYFMCIFYAPPMVPTSSLHPGLATTTSVRMHFSLRPHYPPFCPVFPQSINGP